MNAKKDARRITCALATLAAIPFYVLCGMTHVCMAGHMDHSPYPARGYIADGFWIMAFTSAIVFNWRSNLRLRRLFFWLVLLLVVSRLAMGSGGGSFFMFELPMLLALAGISMRNLFSGQPERPPLSEAEQRARRRRLLRGWGIAIAVLLGLPFAVWGSIRGYRAIRQVVTPVMMVSSIPYRGQVTLKPGEARQIRLPDGKTVAIWCRKPSGFMAAIDDSDLDLEYGERPFVNLDREQITLPEGGVTSGDYKSYIRSGGVTTRGSEEREYELFVNPYALSLSMPMNTGLVLPVTIAVREASADERIPGKGKRDHFLQALHDPDRAVRLKAVEELTEMVTMGSVYKGNIQEIASALRPILQDPDAGIREKVRTSLQAMGDEETLLAMVAPRPADEYLKPNWAWTIADWSDTKEFDKGRVARHVFSFLESDDPRLQEFALAFFSCYAKPYPGLTPCVSRGLKSGVTAVRVAAASAIPACEDKAMTGLYHEALADPADEVLTEALKGGRIARQPGLAVRIVPLMTHTNAEVRRMAAYALDGCDLSAAREALLKATHDPAPKVRAEAAVMLGRGGDPACRERLLALLADPESDVRESAVNGLRWLKAPGTIDSIRPLSTDTNEGVRLMVKRTLRELGG